MNKRAAFALMLALPGLVAADFCRFRPSPDINQPDALRWDPRAHRPVLTIVPSRQPSWASVVTTGSACRRSSVTCPPSVPQHQVRCQLQPERGGYVNAPIRWPHTPRADEQKTAARERQETKSLSQDG